MLVASSCMRPTCRISSQVKLGKGSETTYKQTLLPFLSNLTIFLFFFSFPLFSLLPHPLPPFFCFVSLASSSFSFLSFLSFCVISVQNISEPPTHQPSSLDWIGDTSRVHLCLPSGLYPSTLTEGAVA
eukprot:TRINITY_DN62023_c0_g1_i1.p2 TRINITY_DN62023_c0_g1~~TRINITY_DN62023_c0_g1_i1.p2  ORF type:complete len:128 (+),score=6.07 TRINITY_DN62023_c0_g1_i1:350-733(+)